MLLNLATKLLNTFRIKPARINADTDYINTFDKFTYSKLSHYALFDNMFDKQVDVEKCDLKVYQDLLVYSFINKHIPKGSKILEIGGGHSRILKKLQETYECWNVDKLEGLGNGPLTFNNDVKYTVVQEYMGDFSDKIPNDYFDFTFSISALEHVKQEETNFANILNDINRIMKNKALSLHCFDIIMKPDTIWSNKFVTYLFDNAPVVNKFIPFENLRHDNDAYCMSEKAYSLTWQPITEKSYSEFGKPMSYNILWQKSSN